MSGRTGLRPLDAKVRARRVATGQTLIVESKTLGVPMAYSLPLDNVSRSGMLLSIGTNPQVPFLVNTLLELTVDPARRVFERPVTCLGKVVRLGADEQQLTQFGVQIVQMETRDQDVWERGVTALEAEFAEPLAQLPPSGSAA